MTTATHFHFMLASQRHSRALFSGSWTQQPDSLLVSLATLISTFVIDVLHWLPVTSHIQYKVLLLVTFARPRSSSKIFLFSFAVFGPSLWNNLPPANYSKISIGVPPISSCYLKTFYFFRAVKLQWHTEWGGQRDGLFQAALSKWADEKEKREGKLKRTPRKEKEWDNNNCLQSLLMSLRFCRLYRYAIIHILLTVSTLGLKAMSCNYK